MKKIYLVSFFAVVALCAKIITFGSCCAAGASTEVLIDGENRSWDGAPLIDYPTGKPSITLLRITVAPKSKLPQHYHPVINVGYMLEGSLTVTDDKGNSKTITAGEPLIETVNTIHYGENRGDTDAVILVFYAGEAGETITEISDTYPKK
ncbi:MAG: cupin domain-containing protein [Rikenellaceae bacterium]